MPTISKCYNFLRLFTGTKAVFFTASSTASLSTVALTWFNLATSLGSCEKHDRMLICLFSDNTEIQELLQCIVRIKYNERFVSHTFTHTSNWKETTRHIEPYVWYCRTSCVAYNMPNQRCLIPAPISFLDLVFLSSWLEQNIDQTLKQLLHSRAANHSKAGGNNTAAESRNRVKSDQQQIMLHLLNTISAHQLDDTQQ